MFKKINEKIDVMVDFSKNKVRPLYFYWGNKKYQIKQIKFIQVTKEMGRKFYHFTVTDSINYFKLIFDADDMLWRLTEVCTG